MRGQPPCGSLETVKASAGPPAPDSTRPAPAGTAPARHRIPARTWLDFWFDGALLAAFTLAYSLGFTGLAVHEWLGLGIGLALLLHLTLHWDWVVRTTRRLLSRSGRDRGIWLVNLALLLAMTLCVLSGVLISRVALYQLGISVPGTSFWVSLHDTTAKLTLALVPVHVAMRWRWILSVGRRVLHRDPGRRSQ